MGLGRKIAATAACALLLCGVVAAAVAVPTLLFRVEDDALLNRSHEYPTGTGTLELPPEEVAPVLGAIYATEYVEGEIYQEPNYLSKQSRGEMDTLLPRVWEYTEALMQAGALPGELYDYVVNVILARETLNFTHYIESNGIEVITTNTGMGMSPPYYFSYNIDMNTGLVISCYFQLPSDAPYLIGVAEGLANSWLEYLGLAGEWDFISAEAESYANGEQKNLGAAQGFSDSLRLECYAHWSADPPGSEWGSNMLLIGLNAYRGQTDEWWAEYRHSRTSERLWAELTGAEFVSEVPAADEGTAVPSESVIIE